MKPIKLQMEFIGPYKNETIDFTRLNDSLFLISGRTGSGKSMIFDAITYALFATASTESRGGESLRSQFASDDELSKVNLDFYHRGKKYRIERTLTYKKRTNKNPTTGQAAIYNDFGELIVSGLQEVSKYVEELLHMSARQFRQIALLPQGEFKKLLTANTKDKEEILKTLFGTERFNDVYKSIYKEYKDKDNKRQLLYKEIETQLLSVSDEPVLEFNTSLRSFKERIDQDRRVLNKKKKEIEPVELDIEKLSKTIQEDEQHNERLTEFNKTNVALTELRDKSDEIKETERTLQLVNELSKIKEVFHLEKNVTVKLRQSTKQEETLTNDLNSEEAKNELVTNEIKALKEKETVIERQKEHLSLLNKYDTAQYKNLDASILNTEEEIKESEDTLKTVNSDISLKEKELETNDASIDVLNTLKEEKHSIQIAMNDIKRDIEMQKAEEKKIKQLESYIQQKEKLSEDLAIVIKDKESIVKQFNDISLETNDAINHLLSHLEIGQPCPVCQTVVETYPEHKEVMDAETKDRLTELMNRENECTKDIDRLTIHIEAAESNISDVKYDGDQLREDFSKLEFKLQNIDEQLKNVSEQLERKEKLMSDINELKDSRLKTSEALSYKNESLKNLTQTKESFIAETGLNDYTALEEKITKLTNSVNLHERSLKEAESKRQNIELNIAKLHTELSSVKDNIESFHRDLNEYTPKVESFLNTYDTVDRTNIEAYFKIDDEALQQTVDTFYSKVRELEIKLNTLKESLTSFEVIDITPKEKNLKLLEVQKDELQRVITETEYQLNSDEALIEKLTDSINTYNEDEKRVRELEVLAKIINGNSEGRNSTHPTLSRFVLIHYLELILVYANKRLTEMTNGRYELRRKDTFNAADALIIDVFDHFNNETRNIATLSGGETFQASLALSLSLSEVIQHEAGSINMDMLLIDEGFGTLDEETLNTAINTLVDLQTKGKMVGIISHVEALKTRLQNIIYVETENERSMTNIVTYLS